MPSDAASIGEFQPVFTQTQAGFAFLQFALATFPCRDFCDQIVKRRLELCRHGVERFREGIQLLQFAAWHPDAQVPAGHRLRRARHVPEWRGHHGRQRRAQHEGEHQRQGKHHRRTAVGLAQARQIERFRHGRHQDPVMAGAVIAIRGRVGQPRFPRERLCRDVIELELGRPCRQPRWSGVPRESGNCVRDHRIVGGSGRGDRLAGHVKDESSTIGADGLASQQGVESVFALDACRRRRTCEVVVQLQADVRRHCLMEPCRQHPAHHRLRSEARQSPWRQPSRAPAR